MKNKNGEIPFTDKYNNINNKAEWIDISNDEYIVSSINNGINPIINLLIDSIDKFSFGELLDDDIINDKIKVNIAPNNYLSVNHKSKKEKDLINEKYVINNIEEIIDYNNINITHLEKEESKNKKNKICGIFSKEDFDIKIKLNNRLSDSFEKKYDNPLELDNKTNNEINLKVDNDNKKMVNDINNKIDKSNKENNSEIRANIINGNNNINNEGDYLKIVSDKNIKEVKFNKLNEYNYNLIPINNSKQIDSINNLNMNISNDNIKYNILNEESPKLKKENIFYKDNIINMHIPKEEKSINLPLSLNNNESKLNKKDENNTVYSNKNTDIDVKEKILELSEKLEKSEKNIKMIKNTNEKLLEIINNFTNFKMNDKDIYIKTKENELNKKSFKDVSVKKRYFNPSSNNQKINLNRSIDKKEKKKNLIQEKHNNNHKKSKSFSKLKVYVDGNYSGKPNDDNINYYKINGYDLYKGNTYSSIYRKDKNKKVIQSKLYKKVKQKDPNRLIRNTIFLTGKDNFSNKFKKYNNYPLDNYEAINGNYLYNHSFPSSRASHNKSELLISNRIGNIYQREIMKLPPEQQPLFYESNTKFFLNNYLYTNNINTTCNDTIIFNDQKLNFDEKYNYKKPNLMLEKNENGNNYLNVETNNKKNLHKNPKNKLLDFKDFQIIFEENDNKAIKQEKSIINSNQSYIMNYSNISSDNNRYKFFEKNKNFKKFNNKIKIPSLKNKINYLNNIKNNNNNYIHSKENGKIIKKDNTIKENGNQKCIINKYSEYINQKYNHLFKNQSNIINNDIKDNGKIMDESYNNKNKNQYMIPFYLIDIQELCNSIINSVNSK